MNRSLCLLLLCLNWDVEGYSASYRQGSHRTFLGYSGNSASDTDTDTDTDTDDSWSNTKREDSMCFKRGLFLGNSVDDEIEEELAEINLQRVWNGRKVVYKIDNLPKCSDIKDPRTVKRLIDEAAEAWNRVPNANVMLVNIDDTESSNEVEEEEFSNDTEEEEFSNDTEEISPYQDVDIIVSFEPCIHLKYRDKKPNAFLEQFNEQECETVYAHAHFFGDIHLNELMTWSDKVYTEDEVRLNDYLKPNLYSIALHEFGHSLGLRHSLEEENAEDVMYWDFSGMRKYSRLTLSQNDKNRLVELYPVKERCRDKIGFCSRDEARYCNDVTYRPLCAKTCGLCDECESDSYMKCTPSICTDSAHPLRPFCRKTCNLCLDDPGRLESKCTGLPTNISGLVTDAQFPVSQGTPVKVGCEEGFTVDGNDVITCVKGTLFSWEDEEPECEPLLEGDGECADLRKDPCKKLKKLSESKPSKFRKKCNKSVWKKSCMLTCEACDEIDTLRGTDKNKNKNKNKNNDQSKDQKKGKNKSQSKDQSKDE